ARPPAFARGRGCRGYPSGGEPLLDTPGTDPFSRPGYRAVIAVDQVGDGAEAPLHPAQQRGWRYAARGCRLLDAKDAVPRRLMLSRMVGINPRHDQRPRCALASACHAATWVSACWSRVPSRIDRSMRSVTAWR